MSDRFFYIYVRNHSAFAIIQTLPRTHNCKACGWELSYEYEVEYAFRCRSRDPEERGEPTARVATALMRSRHLRSVKPLNHMSAHMTLQAQEQAP